MSDPPPGSQADPSADPPQGDQPDPDSASAPSPPPAAPTDDELARLRAQMAELQAQLAPLLEQLAGIQRRAAEIEERRGAGSPGAAPTDLNSVRPIEDQKIEDLPAPELKIDSLEGRREETRSDLSRSILWLLAFAVGGVLLFIGTGQLEAITLVQSIFPSLVTLAGSALGFYFGAQAAREGARPGGGQGDGGNPG